MSNFASVATFVFLWTSSRPYLSFWGRGVYNVVVQTFSQTQTRIFEKGQRIVNTTLHYQMFVVVMCFHNVSLSLSLCRLLKLEWKMLTAQTRFMYNHHALGMLLSVARAAEAWFSRLLHANKAVIMSTGRSRARLQTWIGQLRISATLNL